MNTTVWNAIENQIKSLSVVEQQIEKVRTLLAEDWRFRTSAGTDIHAPKSPCLS
jgi:regulator of sirC expression with transglutaminase-like and TPR domain